MKILLPMRKILLRKEGELGSSDLDEHSPNNKKLIELLTAKSDGRVEDGQATMSVIMNRAGRKLQAEKKLQ